MALLLGSAVWTVLDFHRPSVPTDLPEQLSNDHVTLDTYEDLVRHHVEQFYASAKLFQQETALARRVKQWEVSIAPALEEQVRKSVRGIALRM